MTNNKLGAIPLSPEILNKANLGIWAFELDEGSEPRMYVDDVMAGLLFIENNLSPEETYHAWYDHVDPDAYYLVTEAVEKMKVEHAEVQYRWHAPNGEVYIVRCGGVRNPAYTKGIRIEGTHQNVTKVLHYDEDFKTFEQIENAKRILKSVSALSDQFDPIIVIDPVSGKYEWLMSLAEDVAVNTNMNVKGNDFYKDIARDSEQIIHKDDRVRFQEIYSKENLLEIARTGSTQETNNRWFISTLNEYRWKYNKVVRMFDENSKAFIVVGVSDVTEEYQAKLRTRLGAVPLDNEILNKANIGLWAFEIDEGKEPRMYVDDTMLHLLGLKYQVSPEETYHAWYDHVDPEAYDLVAEAVEKMKVGHSEVQYRWFHPNGTMMIVRCGGVRNPAYTEGVRIEGTHQNVSEVLHYDEEVKAKNRLNELGLRHERLHNELLNYIIDHEDEDPIEVFKIFAVRLRALLDCDQVILRDLEETRIMVNSESIEKTWSVPMEYCQKCEHFDAHHPMYANGYTEMENCQEGWHGIPVYKKCPIKSSLTRLIRVDGEIYGYLAIHYVKNYHQFSEVERRTLEEFSRILSIALSRYKSKQESTEAAELRRTVALVGPLASEYDPIMVINPETGSYHWARMNDELLKYSSIEQSGGDISRAIQKDVKTSVHEDDRERFLSFFTEGTIKHVAETGESKEIETRWWFEDERKYHWKLSKAVQSFDAKGNTFVVVGVKDITAEKEQEEIVNAQREQIERDNVALKENMVMMGGLAEGYYSIYYVNFAERVFKSYYSEYTDSGKTRRIITRDDNVYEFVKSFAESGEVHPDDRTLFYSIDPKFLAEALAHTKKFTARFRRLVCGQYRWHEMDIIKFEEIEEAPNALAIGFADRDEQIRTEMERNEQLKQTLLFTNYFLGTYASAYYVGLDDLSFRIYKENPDLNKSVLESGNYLDAMHRFVDANVHPDDKENLRQLLEPQNMKRLLKNKSEINFVFRNIATGDIRYFKLQIIRGADEKHAAFGFSNITDEIKNEQAKEQEIINHLRSNNDRILALTDDFESLYEVNLDDNSYDIFLRDESAYATTKQNFTKLTDFFKDTFENTKAVIHPDDRSALLKILDKESIIKELEAKTFLDYYYRLLVGDQYLWYRIRIRYKDVDKKHIIVGVFNKNEEVLARKKLEDQQVLLEEAAIKAEAANKAKTTFLFNMSHDIRTPMNAIIGYSNMAMKNADNPRKVLDSLDKAQEASQLLLSLINSILDMSRIESGKAKLEETAGDVTYSFANVQSTLEALAKAKNIDLTFEVKNVQDRFVYADYDRCARVFVNIVNNAIKYTHPGGYCHVTCEQISPKRDGRAFYRYTFEDNGIGMSDEFQKHVFDEFSREENSTTRGIQGTGLGMALVKALVDLMQGTISCKSKQGEGTTFTIDVPFRIQDDEERYIDPDTGRIYNRDNDDLPVELDFKGKKILIVEDNPLNIEIATDILTEQGFDVETASNGSVSVKILKEKGPDYYDAILMDIQMPIMGGYEATKLIRKMYPEMKCPIIALSANAFEEDKEASRNAGLDDHIAKPIDIKQLFACLARHM